MFAPTVRVQEEPFDTGVEIARLEGRGDVGALVSFIGQCRDENGALTALELEHYPGMAEEEIARIAAQACERWPLEGLTVIHRHGVIKPGEKIVLVVAAARHRSEAFAAAEFLMDYLKTSAPFWKKERRADGADGCWIDAKAGDDEAAARWTKR
jgi:molybdopterin synthase catalytic subunit